MTFPRHAGSCGFLIVLALVTTSRSALAADSQPNFNGVWISAVSPGAGGANQAMRGMPGTAGAQRGRGGGRMRPQVTAEAQRAMDDYDLLVDDPAYECSPSSLARAWGNPTPIEIEQLEDRVVVRHEFMDVVRTVYLEMNEHPDDLVPHVTGHSIGWYDGSALVIDTIGFAPSVLATVSGLPQTETLHTVERLTLADDGQTFQLELTSEDPAVLTAPWISTRPYRRAPEMELLSFDCVLEDAGYQEHIDNE